MATMVVVATCVSDKIDSIAVDMVARQSNGSRRGLRAEAIEERDDIWIVCS